MSLPIGQLTRDGGDGRVRAPRPPAEDLPPLGHSSPPKGGRGWVEVVAPGPLATIQDLGRPGLATLGVGASGAADRSSLCLANRLVGNPESHAAIEATFGGLWVRFTRAALVAITGAACPIKVGKRATQIHRDMNSPLYVRAGDELCLGAPRHGLRSYLAVRGGIEAPLVLGSRATDTLAGLGPPPLTPGTRLAIGERALGYPCVDHAPQPAYLNLPLLRVTAGPRDSWFVDDALDNLTGGHGYEVTPQANRIGIRLAGPPLRPRDSRELPPEPTVTGALQVPPHGQPILLLTDHPVTGGYPVIAVVHPDDLPLAAQARPGQRLRFVLDHSMDRLALGSPARPAAP